MIASPFYQLTKKKHQFKWSTDCQKAFNSLKTALTSTKVLAYPNAEDGFILDTDASNTGMGAVLSQVQQGTERVIAYASKTLSASQRAYCTMHKELLAVVTLIKHFHYYLYGQKFRLRTDHASLTWLCKFKEPGGMVARWLSILGTYDFSTEHWAGTRHGNADGLSCQPVRRQCN